MLDDPPDCIASDETASDEFGGVPELCWLDGVGEGVWKGDTLSMRAPAMSDWFSSPVSGIRERSAPALVFPPSGDFQLSSTVTVEFGATFDAGVLFVHQTDDDFAKLCFERSPESSSMVVSVVTRVVSDDANGPVIQGGSVDLRVSRFDRTFGFHYAIDGGRWNMVRLFSLRDPFAPTRVGFLAQSPTGGGSLVEFKRPRYRRTTLIDPRDGS